MIVKAKWAILSRSLMVVWKSRPKADERASSSSRSSCPKPIGSLAPLGGSCWTQKTRLHLPNVKDVLFHCAVDHVQACSCLKEDDAIHIIPSEWARTALNGLWHWMVVKRVVEFKKNFYCLNLKNTIILILLLSKSSFNNNTSFQGLIQSTVTGTSGYSTRWQHQFILDYNIIGIFILWSVFSCYWDSY